MASNTTIIKRTGQAPLRIRGEEIASYETSNNNTHPDFEGTGVSSLTRVFKTASGKFVASVEHYTCWQGSHDTYEAAVFSDLASIISWLSGRIPHFALGGIIKAIGDEKVAEVID